MESALAQLDSSRKENAHLNEFIARLSAIVLPNAVSATTSQPTVPSAGNLNNPVSPQRTLSGSTSDRESEQATPPVFVAPIEKERIYEIIASTFKSFAAQEASLLSLRAEVSRLHFLATHFQRTIASLNADINLKKKQIDLSAADNASKTERISFLLGDIQRYCDSMCFMIICSHLYVSSLDAYGLLL